MSKELKSFLELVYSICKQFIAYYDKNVKGA